MTEAAKKNELAKFIELHGQGDYSPEVQAQFDKLLLEAGLLDGIGDFTGEVLKQARKPSPS